MTLTVVICRHSNGPNIYPGPIGKPAIGVLTEGRLHQIYSMAGNVHEVSTVEAYCRARSEHDVFHSALYSRATKQNNCTVCYKTGVTGSLQVGEIYCFACIKSNERQKIYAIITPFDSTTDFRFTSSQDVNSYLEQRIIPIHRPAVRREEYVDICEISKCIPIHFQGQWFVCVFANTLHCVLD